MAAIFQCMLHSSLCIYEKKISKQTKTTVGNKKEESKKEKGY